MPSTTATVVRNRHSVFGAAGGVPNVVVYFGPELDLDGADSPVTAANTLRVTRFDESTGDPEHYEPGGMANDFTTLDRGSLDGGTSPGRGLGRHYVIFAKADFTLDHSAPA